MPYGTTDSATDNPFASTHSLNDNPFDDPTPAANAQANLANEQRLKDIERREQELAARERELNQRADQIRRTGRNNWPPCASYLAKFFVSVMLNIIAMHSFPTHLPLN
jgi:hypothetical protein